MKLNEKWPNIQRFAEGGAGDAGAAAANAGKGAQPADGDAETPDAAGNEKSDGATSRQTVADKATLFRGMITGDYREEFQQAVQGIIDKRFAKAKKSEAALQAASPILEMLANKYGVKGDDMEALSAAIEADQSFWEEDAAKAGMSVAQYKEFKRLERENGQLRRQAADDANKRQEQEAMQKLMGEVEDAKKLYPSLDLEAELQNPETGATFGRLLRAGVPVQTCFEVAHRDDIMMGAMQYAGQKAADRVAASVQANRARPVENGASASGAASNALNVEKMSKEDRRNLIARARNGERIEL